MYYAHKKRNFANLMQRKITIKYANFKYGDFYLRQYSRKVRWQPQSQSKISII